MASLVWGVPVFEFFQTYDHGIAPTLNRTGHIASAAEFNKLVPAANIRVEIERCTSKEELRVVSDLDGGYHVTNDPSIAREILTEIDQHTSTLFEFDINAYPEGIPPGEEKRNDYHRHIIQYDEKAQRILPGIRRAGFLSTIEEYQAKESDGNVWIMEEDFFVGITDVISGGVWWATADVAREVLRRRRDMDDSCPFDDKQDGTPDVENVSKGSQEP